MKTLHSAPEEGRRGPVMSLWKDSLFYMYVMLLTYLDIYFAWLVIAASNDNIATASGAKSMLLGMQALKILVDFDDMVANYYLKFTVKITEDGFALLKKPTSSVVPDTNRVVATAELLEYEALTMQDLRMVSMFSYGVLFSIFFT